MRPRWKRWGVLLLGWIFVLLGIVGLVVPVLQGVLFLAIGLLILSAEYAWAQRLISKLLARFPWIERRMERAPRWLKRWMPRAVSFD